MVTIRIEVISDIVCLWCFIGKRTLERAIALYQKTYPGGKYDTFSIIWKPYYLNYNRFVSSTQSVDKSEVSKVKFEGVSAEKMAAMSNRVHQIAKANGIDFKFEGKIGSTRDAHRLIHFAQVHSSPEVQDALVEQIFQAYHEKAMDISDRGVLKTIAASAGLSETDVAEYLSSERDKAEIDTEAEENRHIATTGVPTFIVQDKYRVDGAQELEEFFDSFVKIKEGEQSV